MSQTSQREDANHDPRSLWQTLADAPAPAKTARARLTQMREIARSFSADMVTVIEPKTKHHLRLLPQPLLQYVGTRATCSAAPCLPLCARLTRT
jgi:hypothetical protein